MLFLLVGKAFSETPFKVMALYCIQILIELLIHRPSQFDNLISRLGFATLHGDRKCTSNIKFFHDGILLFHSC